MPSGAVSDLEVLDPVEVCQNRFGQVPPRPLQVIDVAEDPQVLVPHLVEEAHGGRHGRQQKARYVDGVEWLDQDAHPGARSLLNGVEQALSHARPLGLEWHVRQRDPYVAEQLRAAQLIGDRERAGDAVAELDPAPRVVGDTDLASGMVAPGQVELHLPSPLRVSAARIARTSSPYGSGNSTASKPAAAARSNRSRNGYSEKSRLICPPPMFAANRSMGVLVEPRQRG